MNDPYVNSNENENTNPVNTEAQNTADNDSNAVWSGENYHSGRIHSDDYTPQGGGYSSAQPGQAQPPYNAYATGSSTDPSAQQQEPVWHQTTWQPQQYGYRNPAQPPRPKKNKDGSGHSLGASIVASVLAAACTLGAFTGLVNTGVIPLGNSGSTSSGSAFSITRMIGETSSASTTSTSTGKLLTKQQVCEKVIPSVVLVQNYQNTSNGFSFSGTGTNGNGTTSGSTDGTSAKGTSSTAATTNTSLFGESGGTSSRTSSGSEDNSSGAASEGSGVITSSDGYIMTNAHVVDGATALKVVLSNGKSYEAKLIGSDTVTDLALIKIEATGLTAAEFGDSSNLKIGDEVVAIGNPGGSELVSSATFGNVSALNRTITDSDTGYTRSCIQTDAAINPGNSGGALVNMYGQVVGINSSKLTQVGGTSAEGLGFAIPISTAQPVISSLKQYGYVKDRAVLGISGRMVDATTARIYGLSNTGFVIQKITNTELTKAGVAAGDMITKIDGTTVASSGTITSIVTKKKAGDTVKLSLVSLQTGQSKEVTVKLMAQTGKS